MLSDNAWVEVLDAEFVKARTPQERLDAQQEVIGACTQCSQPIRRIDGLCEDMDSGAVMHLSCMWSRSLSRERARADAAEAALQQTTQELTAEIGNLRDEVVRLTESLEDVQRVASQASWRRLHRRPLGRDDNEMSSTVTGSRDPRGAWPRSVEYRGKTYWIDDVSKTTNTSQVQMTYSSGRDLLSVRIDNWATAPKR